MTSARASSSRSSRSSRSSSSAAAALGYDVEGRRSRADATCRLQSPGPSPRLFKRTAAGWSRYIAACTSKCLTAATLTRITAPLSECLSAYPSSCHAVRLSVGETKSADLSGGTSACLSACTCASILACPSVSLSAHLSNCLSTSVSVLLAILLLTSSFQAAQAEEFQFVVGVYSVPMTSSSTLWSLVEGSWGKYFNESLQVHLGDGGQGEVNVAVKRVLLGEQFQHSIDGVQKATRALKTASVSVVIGRFDVILELVTSSEHITYLVVDCPPPSLSSPSPLSSLTRGRGEDSPSGIVTSYVLYMLPPCDVLDSAAADIAAVYKWDDAALLYDSEHGLSVARTLLARPSTLVGAWPIAVSDVGVLEQLLLLRQQRVDQIVVACETATLARLMKVALKLSMLSDRYAWLYVSLNGESVDFEPFLYTHVNFTTFSLYPTTALGNKSNDPRYSNTTSTSDSASGSGSSRRASGMGPTGAESVASSVVTETLRRISSAIPALVQSVAGTSAAILNCPPFCSPNLNVNATQLIDVIKTVARKDRSARYSDRNVLMNSTLGILSLRETGLQEVGRWEQAGGPKPTDRLTISYQTNLTGRVPHNFLKRGINKVVTLIDAPFVQYKSDYHNRSGNDRYEGFLIDMLENLAAAVQFQYELYESPDGNYGSKNSAGKWNGMIQELILGNAAMCLGAISITADRESAVDFTKPFKMKMFNLLMKKPEKHSTIFQFLSPLSAYVWIMIIVSMAAVSVLLFVMDRVSPNNPDNPGEGFSLQESVWFIYGSLVGGGTERVPRRLSGRLLASAWWFFGLILVSSYTANLAAFLTISKIETSINSVEDLAKQTQIKYGTVRNTYAMSMFKNSQLEVFQRMWSNMKHGGLVNNTAEGIARAKQGDYAFIWDAPINRYIANHDCEVMATGEPFDEKGYGIGIPDRAVYREQLSTVILKMSESGVIKQLENKWWRGGSCEESDDKGSISGGDNPELDVFNVAGVFLLLGIGALIGLLACLAEYLTVRYAESRPDNTNKNGRSLSSFLPQSCSQNTNSSRPEQADTATSLL